MWRISPIKHTHFVYASMSWFSYQSLILCVCVCAMWWETTVVFKLWCHNAKLWWQLSTFTSSGFPILLPTGKDATVLLTMYIIQGIAQLVQCQTKIPGTGFFFQSTFNADYYSDYTTLRTIACLNICMHVQNPTHWQRYHCLDTWKYCTCW